MDDWTMYQITGDPVYIGRFRRNKAVRAGFMGGSLGAIAVFSTAMITQQTPFGRSSSGRPGTDFPPRWLPRRCAGAGFLGFALCAVMSYRGSAELVGLFMIPQSMDEPAPEPAAEAPPKAGGGNAATAPGHTPRATL
mmetsp:Transcript_29404/g.64289  ORF Transcript_29404/g.64289 Transcript_29404/m.64289 type:complete len:137 (-) Transcript_29404:68-478(-)